MIDSLRFSTVNSKRGKINFRMNFIMLSLWSTGLAACGQNNGEFDKLTKPNDYFYCSFHAMFIIITFLLDKEDNCPIRQYNEMVSHSLTQFDVLYQLSQLIQ
jgi:hypothetical protein